MNKQIDGATLEVLNCYRNKYYADGNNTEQGLVANAINDVLPTLVELKNGGYRKSTDVAAVAIDKFRDAIIDVFIDMCCGNDYNKVTLLQIGDAIDAVYDKKIAELYESEGADDEQCT